MGYRRHEIAPGEWYHCFARGIDKRTTFSDSSDYRRFQEALYLCNSKTNIERGRVQNLPHEELLRLERGEPLVAIGAYCLMSNHFHLLLKEISEGGISKFMQKLGTSYTMYFNVKNGRTGGLFVGPFRSRHITEDGYLSRIVPYIHLNPAEIFEPGWKRGIVRDLKKLERHLREYSYSSFPDYEGTQRDETSIIDLNEFTKLLDIKMPPLETLLPEMAELYQDLEV